MRQIVRSSLEHLEQGERLIWCVILSAQGSTPRKAGARMAVFADGSTKGTVGGGAVELQAADLCRRLLAEGGPAQVRAYDLDQGGRAPTGMVCGGRVELGFLPLSQEALSLLRELNRAMEAKEALWLCTELSRNGASRLSLLREDIHSQAPRLPRSPCLERTEDGWRLTEPVAKDYRVWLFGGGHVGAALAPLLLSLDFPVTVCDPRAALLTPERWPGAGLKLLDFSQISRALEIRIGDYAVVMTPGHEMDLLVLRQLLSSPASYIGCIGSKRKTAYVNQVLREEGWSPAQIGRIHAPIGLPIGAKTPEEIAVSVAAEMIRHRAGLEPLDCGAGQRQSDI